MKKETLDEVVKLRLAETEKEAMEAIAYKECRTFAAQIRLAVKEWLERKKKGE